MHRSNEPDAFLAFERAGWNTVISGYERLFGPLTAQTVAPILDAAGVVSGCQVLDVCTGHGVLETRRKGVRSRFCGRSRRNGPSQRPHRRISAGGCTKPPMLSNS